MKKTWWKEAVAYQIYPRSFCDSDGDGIGDLQGIISKLDYIQNLGVDVIWLSPIYKSPNDDNGYDVSDYQAIMDEFGTMADFDQLLDQVHDRGMKLIMDLIVNHTSDEHPWFLQSRSSKNNPYRDWYYWRPGKSGREPNNWESIFRGSAWQYDAKTDEYYLHLFSKKQPDLNWENPDVRNAIYEMMRWWLDKGVDGFRLDAINFLSKTPGLPDARSNGHAPYVCASEHYAFGPRLFEFLKEMQDKVLRHYDTFTVGEAAFATTQNALDLVNEGTGYLNLIFHFEHVHLDTESSERITWIPRRLEIPELKQVLTTWQHNLEGVAWNAQFFGNHDLPRAVSKYGNDKDYRVESAKLLGTVLYTIGGTPFIYQGDEIGMTNVAFPTINDYRDIATLNAFDEYVAVEGKSPTEVMPLVHQYSRDNARTPMQWDDSPNAGFTIGEPWLKVNPNYKDVNVASDQLRQDSVLNFYKELAKVRKSNPVLVYGRFEEVGDVPDDVIAYKRILGNSELLVLANFSDYTVALRPDLFNGYTMEALLLSNYLDNSQGQLDRQTLRPYEGCVYLKETAA